MPLDSIFIRALQRKPTPRTPVWMMRQAGRYLPEYREIRAKAGDFMTLCQTPELACEVTLQPLRRYALDAAILFSDILTIPDAMGLQLHFKEGEGPCFERPLKTEADILSLPTIDIEKKLAYVFDAVRLIRQEMPSHLPLIGFTGSPWTLACYMIEGGSSREFKKILKLMYENPAALNVLLSKLSDAIVTYLDFQVLNGANALMIFDTWGGILSEDRYQTHSLAYMAKIVRAIKLKHPEIPVIVFTKGGGLWLDSIANIGCDAVGIDWTCSLSHARALVGEKVALQGNLHPSILLTSPAIIEEEVARVLAAYGKGSGHVFNLGHGITPEVPPHHVNVMIEAISNLSPAYHL